MKKPLLTFCYVICCMLMGTMLTHAQNFRNQSDLQWIAVPDDNDWTYKLGKDARVDLQLLWHGMPLENIEVSYSIGGDCLEADTQGSVKTDARGNAEIRIKSPKKAGFRDCMMTCEVEGVRFDNHIKVGWSPERLTAYTQMPKDFEAFWKQVLEEQEKASKLKPVVKPAPEYSNDRVDCYLVKLNGGFTGAPHCIYGYLSIPKKAGKFPVLVSPPGAGVKHMDPLKTQFYASEGNIIRLELEIHGINPSISAEDYKDISRSFGDHMGNGYLANGIQSRDTYYMKKVYACLLRAVDYLTTLEQWDGKNILIQGNSQGAALSIVLAGLDPRITAVAIAHPALSDMAGYAEDGRTGGYPHFNRYYKEVKLDKQTIETLSYYDVVNFARLVKCPVYLTWGYNDNTCPPTTSWIVWNTLSCEKEKYITPINEHWISTETRYRQMRFLQKHLK
jgi:cephalosporin-C deacetylase-like acetyl esterase